MNEQINRIMTTLELEPDPVKRMSMMAVLRQTLDKIRDQYGDEGERRG